MNLQRLWPALLLPLMPHVQAQSTLLVITIGVGHCSTGGPFSYGSMGSPTSNAAGLATSSAIPSQSTTSYTDRNGQTYSVQSNTGLSGTPISPAGSMKRQAGDQVATNGTFDDCLVSCDAAPACQAVNYLGTTCILYGAVTSTMYLLGGEAAFNTARFHGFASVSGSSSPAGSTTPPAAISNTAVLPASSVGAGSSPPPNSASNQRSSSLPPIASIIVTPVPAPSSSQAGCSPALVSLSAYPSSQAGPGLASSPTSSSPVWSTLLIDRTSIPGTSKTPAGSIYVATSSTPITLASLPSLSTPTSSPFPSFTYVPPTPPLVQPPSLSVLSTSLGISSSSSGVPLSSALPPALTTTPIISTMGAVSSSILRSSTLTSVLIVTSSLAQRTTTSTTQSPTASAGLTCPASDGATVTDANGIQYSIKCVSDTSGGLLNVQAAQKSFNECFGFCDSASGCTGFTYSGGANGVGGGNCYLKTGSIGFSSGSSNVVAGIRVTLPSVSSTASAPSSAASSIASSAAASTTRSSATSSSVSSSAAVAAPTYVRNSGKRGLCYTNDSLTLGYALSGQNSQVSWEYDYFYSRFTGSNLNNTNAVLTFIPLMFSDAADLGTIWPAKAQAAIDAGADALMSFNEPDLCIGGSACMSINQSVVGFKKYFQPFAGKVRLGAPAVTNQGSPGGLTYLSQFMGNCTGCNIDFINVHWYSNKYAGLGYLQTFVQQAYAMFGLPIWVTEFGLDNSEGTPSDTDVQAFLKAVLPWLDAYPHVERYAYFYDGPGYLIKSDGSGLSAQGVIYNSYTVACANWNTTSGHC